MDLNVTNPQISKRLATDYNTSFSQSLFSLFSGENLVPKSSCQGEATAGGRAGEAEASGKAPATPHLRHFPRRSRSHDVALPRRHGAAAPPLPVVLAARVGTGQRSAIDTVTVVVGAAASVAAGAKTVQLSD